MKNDNAVPQTAEEVGTQVSGKRAHLAQVLEQASALPTNEAPKVTGRKRLKKTTQETEQEDRARIDQVLSEQAIAANVPVTPGTDKYGNKLRADVIEVNGSPIMLLKQQYVTPQGKVTTMYPRLDEGFSYRDEATGISRHYRMVKWHADLRQQGDELGFDVWLNSLSYHDQQGDGLWLREDHPEPPEDTSDTKGKKKKGGGGGGGRGTWQTISTTPCYIKSIVIDERNSHFLEVERCNMYGVWATVRIGLDQLHDNGQGPVWKELSRTGMPMSNKETQRFRQMALDYVAMATGNALKYIKQGRNKPGWHQITDSQGTHLEYITSGFSTAPNVPYTGSQASPWSTKGDRELYFRRFAKMMVENPVVALDCGFNAAGLFISFIPEMDHNPIKANLGESSIGKSLDAETGMSMRGYPPMFLKNMDATDNALKSRMRNFNHTGGAVDEVGSGDEKNLKEKLANIYQWASGNPRGRTQKNAFSGEYEERSPDGERYYYTLMLTGEESFVNMDDANTGNKVRLTQIIFGKNNPLWHGIKNKDEAEEWRKFIYANHGWLYPELVRLIAQSPDTCKEYYSKFSARLSEHTESQQQARKANAWALSLAGVELISDILSKVQDEDGQWVEGFTEANVEETYQHAVRLMKTEMDSMPIESESDMFWAFIRGLPTRYAADLYIYAGNSLDQTPKSNPKGSYRVYSQHEPVKGGQVKVHELCILKPWLEHMKPSTMDTKRLLKFFKDEKISSDSDATVLATRNQPRKSDGGVSRRETVFTNLANGLGRAEVYKFTWTERLTDEIDLG